MRAFCLEKVMGKKRIGRTLVGLYRVLHATGSYEIESCKNERLKCIQYARVSMLDVLFQNTEELLMLRVSRRNAILTSQLHLFRRWTELGNACLPKTQ